MFRITELPAIRHDECGTMPVTDPQVGDRVIVHSRGSYREALVEKVGRTNVTVVYTTEGAIRDAQKYQRTPEQLRAEAETTRSHYEDTPEHVTDYIERVLALADRVEALPASRRWEEFVNVTRKSVKITETFEA